MRTILAIYASLTLAWPITAGAADAVHFITFGDWGNGCSGQKEVAAAAQNYCARFPCQFVLTLGDNFYENGVRSVTDLRWRTYYKDIYSPLRLPFYAILGNHDERGSIQAQMDYGNTDTSWHMPGQFYSVRFPKDADVPVIEIFVINNGDDRFQPEEKQWLEQALAASRAQWKILAAHKPLISNGSHGDNASTINDQMVPVICNKVDVALSGHDHLFSHLKGPWGKCMIDQLIVGTGGMRLRKPRKPDPRVLATGSFYGFGWIAASPHTLTFRMIRSNGKTIYETTWKK